MGRVYLQGLWRSTGAAPIKQRVEARRALSARVAHHLPELRRAGLLRAGQRHGAHYGYLAQSSGRLAVDPLDVTARDGIPHDHDFQYAIFA